MSMTKRYAFVLVALAVAIVMMFVARGRKRFFTNEGVVWTTEYHITYEAAHDLGDSIQLIFNRMDMSVSPYNKASLISSLNENTSTRVDAYIKRLMEASVLINQESGGAFDPTVMPLVNAWGFGYKNGNLPTPDEFFSGFGRKVYNAILDIYHNSVFEESMLGEYLSSDEYDRIIGYKTSRKMLTDNSVEVFAQCRKTLNEASERPGLSLRELVEKKRKELSDSINNGGKT